MTDLTLGILTEFASRQRLAPIWQLTKGLRVTRPRAPSSYWVERRAAHLCNCGKPTVPQKSRCAACAAKRTKGVRVLAARTKKNS